MTPSILATSIRVFKILGVTPPPLPLPLPQPSVPLFLAFHQQAALIFNDTTSHHQSQPVATSHHQPPPVATSRHQSPPVATNHHQSPPVATDHHQPDPSFLHQKGNHDKHIHRPHRLVVRFDSFVPRLPFTRCWTSTQRNFVDASKRSSRAHAGARGRAWARDLNPLCYYFYIV